MSSLFCLWDTCCSTTEDILQNIMMSYDSTKAAQLDEAFILKVGSQYDAKPHMVSKYACIALQSYCSQNI